MVRRPPPAPQRRPPSCTRGTATRTLWRQTREQDPEAALTRIRSSWSSRTARHSTAVRPCPPVEPELTPPDLTVRPSSPAPARSCKPFLLSADVGLQNCDNFMNLTMKEVYQTSAVRTSLCLPVDRNGYRRAVKLMRRLRQDGEQFWKLTECYVRGNNVRSPLPAAGADRGNRSSTSGWQRRCSILSRSRRRSSDNGASTLVGGHVE